MLLRTVTKEIRDIQATLEPKPLKKNMSKAQELINHNHNLPFYPGYPPIPYMLNYRHQEQDVRARNSQPGPFYSNPVVAPAPQSFPDPSSQLCVRCNQAGHSPNNCYAIICSTCKQIGHSFKECSQGKRRVHFLQCVNCNETYEHPENLHNCTSPSAAQGNS